MLKRRSWLGLALAVPFLPGVVRAQGGGMVVFAAASLKTALDEIAATWAKDTGKPAPRISYAASSALARQMEQGAPADLFISADLDWMDYAAGKNLIKADTRFNLLGNKIVLIAPRDSRTTALALTGGDLAKALAGGKLSMGNVDAVPAGKYGKAALEKLGAWASVKDSIAQAENVRAALAFVSRGEAPVGIVYATDAKIDPGVKIVGTFPDGSHPPVTYPVAATANAKPEAARYLDFLRTPAVKAIFETYGFSFLLRPTS